MAKTTLKRDLLGRIDRHLTRAVEKALTSKAFRDAVAGVVRKALTDQAVDPWLRQKIEFIERQNRRLFFSTSTYLGDHVAETWITSGQRIFVDTRDLGIAQHLMFKGFWEKTSNDAFRSLLREDDTFVDIGAHYGFHTVTCAQHVARGRVVAVEPNPRVHSLLERSVRINQLRDRVTVHRCAIAEAPGRLNFVCPQDDPALGHLEPLGFDGPDVEGERVEVAVESLDRLLGDLDRIDLMKIDVEGHELQALRGGRQVIERHPGLKIALEYAPAHIERQVSTDEFHRELRALGFAHVYEIVNGRLERAEYDQLAADRNLRNVVLAKDAL
tara:strand:+ start:135 stop:1118 length:984 start_codon:yes stop_codon:yes gene_type:complete